MSARAFPLLSAPEGEVDGPRHNDAISRGWRQEPTADARGERRRPTLRVRRWPLRPGHETRPLRLSGHVIKALLRRQRLAPRVPGASHEALLSCHGAPRPFGSIGLKAIVIPLELDRSRPRGRGGGRVRQQRDARPIRPDDARPAGGRLFPDVHLAEMHLPGQRPNSSGVNDPKLTESRSAVARAVPGRA